MTPERFHELERETNTLLAALSHALLRHIEVNERLRKSSDECVAKSRTAIALVNLHAGQPMYIRDPADWDS